MTSIILERSYPGYDNDGLIFDFDDPDISNSNNSNSLEIHIRQSKSDPILLLPSTVCHRQSGLDNQNLQQPLPLSPSWHQQVSHSWDQEFYHSLEDLNRQTNLDTNMLTIEGLRSHFNSCFSCGVSWYEDHVSLDCSECGGYAMQRPCLKCDGQCDSIWRRDLAASHDTHKAQWEGECKLNSNDKQKVLNGLRQNNALDRREHFSKNLNNL